MAKKQNKNNYMLFCGNNSLDVTGSMIYMSFEGKQILLENGMVQNNDYLENYNEKVDDEIILNRESWWKEIFKSREFGYNKN